jgi:hypothetical protein
MKWLNSLLMILPGLITIGFLIALNIAAVEMHASLTAMNRDADSILATIATMNQTLDRMERR